MSDNDLFKKNRGAQASQKRNAEEQDATAESSKENALAEMASQTSAHASSGQSHAMADSHSQTASSAGMGASLHRGDSIGQQMSGSMGHSAGKSLNDASAAHGAESSKYNPHKALNSEGGHNHSAGIGGSTGTQHGHASQRGIAESAGLQSAHTEGHSLNASMGSKQAASHSASVQEGHSQSRAHGDSFSETQGSRREHSGLSQNASHAGQQSMSGERQSGVSESFGESALQQKGANRTSSDGHSGMHQEAGQGAQSGSSTEHQAGVAESMGGSAMTQKGSSLALESSNVATHCETTVTGPNATESLCVSADLDAVRQDLKNTLAEAGFHDAADKMSPELTAEMVFKSIDAQSNDPLYVDLDKQTVTSHDPGGDNVFVVHPDDVLHSAGMSVQYSESNMQSETGSSNSADQSLGEKADSALAMHAGSSAAEAESPAEAKAEAQAEMDMGGGM